MDASLTTHQALRGLGRLVYRQGGFPSHGVRAARVMLGREPSTEDRQAIVDGWTAERREGVSCPALEDTAAKAIEATRHGLTPALGRDDERDAEVVEIRPRRIKADPRLLKGAAEIESTVLAVLKARGVTLVGPLGSDYTHEDFAKECGRNAMTGVVAAIEEVES